MPLALGGTSTERRQLVTWDPASPEEHQDALVRVAALRARGFKEVFGAEGEIALEPPPKSPDEGVFRVISQNGDDRIVWDRRDPAQVREAFATFNNFIEKGYTAYVTTPDGKRCEKLDVFDPLLEEILLVPATRPG